MLGGKPANIDGLLATAEYGYFAFGRITHGPADRLKLVEQMLAAPGPMSSHGATLESLCWAMTETREELFSQVL